MRYMDNRIMLMDLYELTMAQAWLDQGKEDLEACFEVFFRKVPEDGGYAIMGGVEDLVNFLQETKFTEENLQYLASTGLFNSRFFGLFASYGFSLLRLCRERRQCGIPA